MKAAIALTLVSTGAGCATSEFVAPKIEVLNVRVLRAGVFDQQVSLVLCLTNSNPRPLQFARATFVLDVAGARAVEGQTVTEVDLPAFASVPIPFVAATTTRSLPLQIVNAITAGGVDYRVSGRVTLKGLPISMPYQSAGRFNLNPSTRQLAAAAPTASSGGCGSHLETTS